MISCEMHYHISWENKCIIDMYDMSNFKVKLCYINTMLRGNVKDKDVNGGKVFWVFEKQSGT